MVNYSLDESANEKNRLLRKLILIARIQLNAKMKWWPTENSQIVCSMLHFVYAYYWLTSLVVF